MYLSTECPLEQSQEVEHSSTGHPCCEGKVVAHTWSGVDLSTDPAVTLY